MDTHVKDISVPARSSDCRRPLFLKTVPAGFPSPADDYIEQNLDLNAYLIRHPAATFFVRVSGDSMNDAGINSGDILIVDRAREPVDSSVVIARLESELTVKRIRKRDGKLYLVPDNSRRESFGIQEDTEFEVWGVVTHVIHAL